MIPNKAKELIQKFCEKEYRGGCEPMTINNFKLFAVDCGGYDTTSEITLRFENDSVFLVFGHLEDTTMTFKEDARFKVTIHEN